MARKPQRRVPLVPRSTVKSATTTLPSGVGATPATPGGARIVEQSFAHEYAHVRRDLLRIATLAILIFGTMFILKFVVGL